MIAAPPASCALLQAAVLQADHAALGSLATLFERHLGLPLAPLEAVAVHAVLPLLRSWAGSPPLPGFPPPLPSLSRGMRLDSWLGRYFDATRVAAASAAATIGAAYRVELLGGQNGETRSPSDRQLTLVAGRQLQVGGCRVGRPWCILGPLP